MAEAFRTQQRRTEFILGRVLARLALARELLIPPSEVPIVLEPGGRPSLSHGLGAKIFFSISHSPSEAAVALSLGVPVGVDVEDLREDVEWEILSPLLFSHREVKESHADHLTLWSLKEAYGKALGQGISVISPEVECLPLRLHGDWKVYFVGSKKEPAATGFVMRSDRKRLAVVMADRVTAPPLVEYVELSSIFKPIF